MMDCKKALSECEGNLEDAGGGGRDREGGEGGDRFIQARKIQERKTPP